MSFEGPIKKSCYFTGIDYNLSMLVLSVRPGSCSLLRGSRTKGNRAETLFPAVQNSFLHTMNIVLKIFAVLLAPYLMILSMQLAIESQETFADKEKTLRAAEEEVVEVEDIKTKNPQLNGKLIFLQGTAKSAYILKDKPFQIGIKGMKLRRRAEFYQWTEHERHERRKVRDREEDRVYYEYEQRWCEAPVDSSRFVHRSGHQNNSIAIQTDDNKVTAPEVYLGAYRLNAQEVDNMSPERPYSLAGYSIPDTLSARADVKEDALYITHSGKPNISRPVNGDVRITWFYIPAEMEVSLMAVNKDGVMAPYQAENCQDKLDLIRMKHFDDVAAFLKEERRFRIQENLLRLFLLALMLAGSFRWLLTLVQDCQFMEKRCISGLWIFSGYVGLQISFFLFSLVWIQLNETVGIALWLSMILLYMLYRRYHRRKWDERNNQDDYTLDFNPADYDPTLLPPVPKA